VSIKNARFMTQPSTLVQPFVSKEAYHLMEIDAKGGEVVKRYARSILSWGRSG